MKGSSCFSFATFSSKSLTLSSETHSMQVFILDICLICPSVAVFAKKISRFSSFHRMPLDGYNSVYIMKSYCCVSYTPKSRDGEAVMPALYRCWSHGLPLGVSDSLGIHKHRRSAFYYAWEIFPLYMRNLPTYLQLLRYESTNALCMLKPTVLNINPGLVY